MKQPGQAPADCHLLQGQGIIRIKSDFKAIFLQDNEILRPFISDQSWRL